MKLFNLNQDCGTMVLLSSCWFESRPNSILQMLENVIEAKWAGTSKEILLNLHFRSPEFESRPSYQCFVLLNCYSDFSLDCENMAR